MDPLDSVADEVQSQLRKAHVLRQRGDEAGSRKILDEIVANHPAHPEALLLQAEAFEREGKLKEARDILAPVIDSEVNNITLERKHAELVLKMAERDNLMTFAMSDNLSSLMNPEGARKGAGTAAFFSMLMPGFGQAYNSQFVKGIIFATLAVLGWIGMLNYGVVNGEVTGWFVPSSIVLGGSYLVAIIDAAVVAGRTGASAAIRPQRPVPPVDKPFE